MQRKHWQVHDGGFERNKIATRRAKGGGKEEYDELEDLEWCANVSL